MVLNFLNEAAQPKREFVKARIDIASGKILTAKDLVLSEPMKNTSAQDLFLQVDDAVGQISLERLPAGSLIQRSQVKPKETRAAAPAVLDALPIPEGMRALTVTTLDVVNMPDLLEVGRHVDIMGSVPGPDGRPQLRTLLYGAQVISLEKSKRTPGGIDSTTIALRPNEIDTLTMAMTYGKIRILVRPDQGERSAYQSQVGSIEVIRGMSREKKMTA